MGNSDNILAGAAGGLQGVNDLLSQFIDYQYKKKLKQQDMLDTLGIYQAKLPYELSLKQATSDYENKLGMQRDAAKIQLENNVQVPILGDNGAQIGTTKKGAVPLSKFMSPEEKKAQQLEAVKQAGKPKAQNSFVSAHDNLQSLVDAVDSLLNDKNLSSATGIYGATMSRLPGTAATDARAKLQTIKAKTAFNTLQEMRNNSPTGGALGQVSDREEELLANAIAAINPNQSGEAFKQQLLNLKNNTIRAQNRLRDAYKTDFGEEPPSIKTPTVQGGGSGSVPSVGGTFNGKKVLRVEKLQ